MAIFGISSSGALTHKEQDLYNLHVVYKGNTFLGKTQWILRLIHHNLSDGFFPPIFFLLLCERK